MSSLNKWSNVCRVQTQLLSKEKSDEKSKVLEINLAKIRNTYLNSLLTMKTTPQTLNISHDDNNDSTKVLGVSMRDVSTQTVHTKTIFKRKKLL